MRDFEREKAERIAFIKSVLAETGADGIVYGNSGGKDSALVGILCKAACENTVGLIMPCGSKRNYGQDRADAETVANRFGIEYRVVDLTETRDALVKAVGASTPLAEPAVINIAPRLRMTALYAVAKNENRVVAGTGNRSEIHMGYYTKWGDGACDFNPIADLTVTEIYEFLRYLGAPDCILTKAPSAGLFDGQTDEGEMGITYRTIDNYLLNGTASEQNAAIIDRCFEKNNHKRNLPKTFTKSFDTRI